MKVYETRVKLIKSKIEIYENGKTFNIHKS